MNQSVRKPPVTSQITIPSDCQEMEAINRFMETFLSENEFSQQETDDILMAVQEGVTNAIIHGNNLIAKKSVSLSVNLTDDELRISITDHGTGFDMQALADPTSPENRLKSNGRGLMFIRTFMDEVVSKTLMDGHELLMVRRLN